MNLETAISIFRANGGEVHPDPDEPNQWICVGPPVRLVKPIDHQGQTVDAVQFWARLFLTSPTPAPGPDSLVLEGATVADLKQFILRRTVEVLLTAKVQGGRPVPGMWADLLRDIEKSYN